jgi:hypothetical protein
MMSDLHIENYDFTIIDFNELLIDNIQHQIINSLYEFNLLEKSINNLSVKKFIFHYTIYGICDKLLDCNTKSIVYFNNTQLDDCELTKYYTEKDILTFFTNFLRKVDKILPVKIYISKYSIVYLDHLISINDGKAQTTINSMISKINNLDISRYTFSNVKNFTKRYELTFLNKDYFNRLSTKLLLIR